MENIGHNSGERLKSFIKRIEKLEEDKAAVMEDVKNVYAEAKGTGFDVNAMRHIIRQRRVSIEKRRQQEAMIKLYKASLGEDD